MAEETKSAESADIDPWDFDDPEIEDESTEDIPAESEEGTEDPSDDAAEEIALRAKDAGLSQEDLENMGSSDTVEFVLNLLDNKTQELKEELKNAAVTGDAEKEEQSDASSDSSEDEFSWIDQLDPEESIDSDAVKALKAMKTRMDGLSSELKSMTEQSETVKAENFFVQLDEKWSELFGNAKEQSSQNKNNRETVIEEMNALRDGYRSRKKRIPEESELFERALRSTFGEHEKNFARDEVSSKIKKRESQFLSRAQSRPTKELLTGREKAVSSVAARMRELGLSALDDVGETFE
mgnify:CR=1 FL=1